MHTQKQEEIDGIIEYIEKDLEEFHIELFGENYYKYLSRNLNIKAISREIYSSAFWLTNKDGTYRVADISIVKEILSEWKDTLLKTMVKDSKYEGIIPIDEKTRPKPPE